MSKTIVILMGLQGSGKSTFYSRHLADDFVRVNLDTLKTRHQEKLLIEECMHARLVEGHILPFYRCAGWLQDRTASKQALRQIYQRTVVCVSVSEYTFS